MVNTLFLFWGLIPVALGLGFIFRPRKMVRAQAKFRKRMEQLEKKLLKTHRTTGLALVLSGLVLILSYFHPVWIYNVFVVARLIAGLLFPGHFATPVPENAVIPTVWI